MAPSTRSESTTTDLLPVRRPAAPPACDVPEPGPVCCVLAVEIAEFDRTDRDEEVRDLLRQVLYRLLRRAFDDAGIGWRDCAVLDRGDAYLMIAPPTVPAASLAGPLLGLLRAGLAVYNRYASAVARLRLRAGLHSGPAGDGISGAAVRHAERLAASAPARAQLRGTDTDLALVASDRSFAEAVRPGDGTVGPDAYRPVALGDGEHDGTGDPARGWAALPAPGHLPLTRPYGDRPGQGGWPGAYTDGGPETATSGHPGVTVPVGGSPRGRGPAFGFFGNVIIGGDAVAGDKIVYT